MEEQITFLGDMPIYNEAAIGIDVHSDLLCACALKKGSDGQWIKVRQDFSSDIDSILSLVSWSKIHDPDVIIMESTSVYWMSPYDALDAAGLPVAVVNPAFVKGMRGRKTDHEDAAWLAQIGVNGSYRPSFIPSAEFRHLRAECRLVTKQSQELGTIKNRETKFFDTAGFRLGTVFSDQFGQTAMAAKSAILEGKTPEEVLEAIRPLHGFKRLKKGDDELLKAFQGKLTPSIKRSIESNRLDFEHFKSQVEKGKKELINTIKNLEPKNYRFLQTIPGISEWAACVILIEIGGGEKFGKAFRNPEHFASWLGICPGNTDSNGKRVGKKSRHGNAALRRILCEVAQAAVKCKGTTFKSKFQSLIVRLGYKRSIVAIAHKIAKVIHCLIVRQTVYKDPHTDYQAISSKKNAPRWIKQLSQDYDYKIVNRKTGRVYDSEVIRKQQRFESLYECKKKLAEIDAQCVSTDKPSNQGRVES